MTLDRETRRVLGFGCAWEQMEIRFPLYVVSRQPTRRDWRKRRAGGERPRSKHALTTAQRREATRLAKLGRSSRSIAIALGVGKDSVRTYLKAKAA